MRPKILSSASPQFFFFPISFKWSILGSTYLIEFILSSAYLKNNKIKNILLASADNSSIFNSYMLGSYSDMFEYTYSMLCNYYKCEYVYLNKFFINEILKNHDDNVRI